MPVEATQWIGLQYLEKCWMEAAKWVSITEDKRRHGPQAWRSFLKKERARDAMMETVAALAELRDKGSDLSPSMWCWWRLTQLLEKGDPPFHFYSVWSANALRSTKMRRWYYEEVAADLLCRKKLWPRQTRDAYTLLRAFLDTASTLPRDEDHKALWSQAYESSFKSLLQAASFVKSAAETRLSDRASKCDLGVWLSSDVVVYLKLADVAVSMVDKKPAATTTVRRRKTTSRG